MNLSAPFILRPVMTTLLTVAALVLGLWAYKQLPVANLPDVNYPVITVTATFPGASPEIMANTVATPLEKQFMTIPGIHYITSANTLGSTSIVLQFNIDKNIDLAAVDVSAAITTAKPQLPPNIPADPVFKKVNPSSTPIMYISVTSATLTQGELYDYANTFIGQRIAIIDGVAQVSVFGSPSAVRAQVDPGHAASMGITLSDIAGALSNSNQYEPLGQFDGLTGASNIYDNGGLYKAKDYNPLVIAYRNAAPVKMSDLGIVIDSLQKDRSTRRYLRGDVDQPSVTLAVQGQPGANAVRVADAISQLLPELERQLPGSLDVVISFDRSISIRNSVKDVELTLLIAFALVVLVIFLYLGTVRDTVIPSVVMPLSIIVTFAVMYQLNYTLDNLSLLALTLAIGFIIDDAIVVLENIVRRVEGGAPPLEGALEGSKQISFTIVSMTVSLVAVFIPLIFMAGVVGKLFQEFAITLTIVTVASGIISLTLTPMLCARFIPPHTDRPKGRMARFSLAMNTWMLNHYKTGLEWILRHRKTALFVGVMSVVLSVLLFKVLPTDFIPDEDIGFILAYSEAEQGTSSDQMAKYHRQIVNVLKSDPSIESIISIAGNPVYRQGIVFFALVPPDKRPTINQLIPQFNAKVHGIAGVNVFFKNVPLIDLNIGNQVRGAYQYLMQSLDSKALYESSQKLVDAMRADPTFTGITTDLEIKTPQLNMDIKRDLASTLGIDPQTIEQALQLAYSGNRVSRIQTPVDQYDVIVELNRDMQRSAASLNEVYLRSATSNQLVPVNAVATWSEGVGPASINHFQQFPSVTITFSSPPGIPLSDVLERLRQLAATNLSPQVTGDVKGAAESFEESVRSVGFLLVVTIFAIYIVLGILYESFIHPLTILSTLPPAIVGALLTLYITGRPLSLYAYLGIILLIGIVKKNGIMMVDFALDNIRTKGETAEKSIFDACIVRFRPIMMTTIAAIMGALPVAFAFGSGAEARKPLGLVIIGGLIVSQMITLFLTPVIYLYFETMREKWLAKGKAREE